MGDPVVSFFIPGKPGSKQSFRFSKSGHRYQPRSVVDYQSLVSLSAREAVPDGLPLPLQGPVGVRIVADFLTKNKKEAGPRWKRPDVDNITKMIFDGITAAGIWSDDAQVVTLLIEKYIIFDGEQGVVGDIWPMDTP